MLRNLKSWQTVKPMLNVNFLGLELVLEIHERQINQYGGSHGIRDMGLLESALAVPQFSFAGHYMHDSVSLMGSAYMFHIIKNHPFVDGNKRTGIACGLVFLRDNGMYIPWVSGQMYDIAKQIATSQLSKEELAKMLILLSESS